MNQTGICLCQGPGPVSGPPRFPWFAAVVVAALGSSSPAFAAEKQVAVFDPKVEGGNLGEVERQALDKALAEAIKELGYMPISREDLNLVLEGEKIAKCESAECQVRVARLLDAGYVLNYKIKLSGDVMEGGAKAGKKARGKEPEPAAPSTGPAPTASWKFEASLFNVTLAATAETAQNQPGECANCNSTQAGQSIAELAKRLLVADKSHPRGLIEVTTSPGGASVFVDNVEMQNRTPDDKALSVKTFAGKHKLRVKKVDYLSQEQEVTVAEASPAKITLTLKPGQDPQKVVYVPTEVVQRPMWRIVAGVLGLAAGATLSAFGGMAISVNGQPHLTSDGKEDFTQVYNTIGLGAGLIAAGAVCVVGGTVLLAVPGEKKKAPAATGPTVSFGSVGSGFGLSLSSRY